MEQLTLEEFESQFNGAPLNLEEIAEIAQLLSDDEELRDAATQFLVARDEFSDLLESREIQLG